MDTPYSILFTPIAYSYEQTLIGGLWLMDRFSLDGEAEGCTVPL